MDEAVMLSSVLFKEAERLKVQIITLSSIMLSGSLLWALPSIWGNFAPSRSANVGAKSIMDTVLSMRPAFIPAPKAINRPSGL